MRKEFNSQRISLVHQHGRRFIVLNTNMAALTSRENALYRSSYWWTLQRGSLSGLSGTPEANSA